MATTSLNWRLSPRRLGLANFGFWCSKHAGRRISRIPSVGFACVLASCLAGPCGAFLVGVVVGGCLVCWFGFSSCDGIDRVTASSRSRRFVRPRVSCRWVGQRRGMCPRKGWKCRLLSRVNRGSKVASRQWTVSPSSKFTPLNGLCRGGGGSHTEQDLLKGLQELLQKFNTSNDKPGGLDSKGKGKPTTDHTGKGKVNLLLLRVWVTVLVPKSF